MNNDESMSTLRAALYDYEPDAVQAALRASFDANAIVKLGFPFEEMIGADALYDTAYQPLHTAIPDIERRDTIVVHGTDRDGNQWIGCCGYYTGSFLRPWLEIAPTGRQVSMRYHEFFRLIDGRVVEMQGLWDIPGLMLEAGCWPMSPSLGLEWQVPGPATQDGVFRAPRDNELSSSNLLVVEEMLTNMGKHPAQPLEAMQLEKYWHPKMNWYGPAGIGTARGIEGFRSCHQIPFLRAMPDRRPADAPAHFFAENNYVAVTGWPNMEMTITSDGWMGIAPSGQSIEVRSLDFWRLENGLIRENWVLIDILSVYDQIGVDVFARMKQLHPEPGTQYAGIAV
ncbi:ester cyclase [Arthrobacter sp. SO3]|uniref:ester cyclase n=1 Tax=Arthrobacter sp. SO3 TaxID=1897057 RepID=UPI001CFF6CD5|nr:ester cyclase [Arthrobacter sp. SO3]MCB5292671.1 hypothetical protein [Arthrobacter sp. SO3]